MTPGGIDVVVATDHRWALVVAVGSWMAYLITVRRHRSVQETIRRNIEGKVKGDFPHVSTEVTAANQREQLIESIKDEGPITVIGRITRALDDADDIVYVDLSNCTPMPSVGLDHALERTHGKRAKRVRAAQLQKLDPFAFVSVMGRFRITAESETTTTFSAPYGDPTEFSDDLPKQDLRSAR